MKITRHSLMVQGYLDGEFSPGERSWGEKHIRTCPDCRKELVFLNGFKRRVAELVEVPVPSDYDLKFRNRLKKSAAIPVKKAIPGLRTKDLNMLFPITVPRMVAAAAVVILLIGAGILIPYLTRGDLPHIRSVRGVAEIYRNREARWVRAAPGMTMAAGDILRTGGAARVDLALEDTYSLRITGDSELVAHRLVRSRQEGLTDYGLKIGKAFVQTTAGFSGLELSMETPFARAVIHGTAFVLEVGVENTTIQVENGEVEFSSRFQEGKPEAKVIVFAGTYSRVEREAFPKAPRNLTPAELKILKDEFSDVVRPPMKVSRARVEEQFEGLKLVLTGGKDRVNDLLHTGPPVLRVGSGVPPEVIEQLSRASDLAEEGDYTGSAILLEEILNNDLRPDDRVAVELLLGALHYRLLGQPERALEFFRDIREIDDHDLSSLAAMATAIIKKDLTITSLENVIEDFPESVDAENARDELKKLDVP